LQLYGASSRASGGFVVSGQAGYKAAHREDRRRRRRDQLDWPLFAQQRGVEDAAG
jgi:hypothetical protein